MDKVLALMKPFMKKELMDVMHLHSTMDTFFDKHVPKALMPNEYGGSAGSIKEIQEKNYQHLKENGGFFIDEETNKRVNEKLRPGKPKSESDLFGIDGNFKQLNFDWFLFFVWTEKIIRSDHQFFFVKFIYALLMRVI